MLCWVLFFKRARAVRPEPLPRKTPSPRKSNSRCSLLGTFFKRARPSPRICNFLGPIISVPEVLRVQTYMIGPRRRGVRGSPPYTKSTSFTMYEKRAWGPSAFRGPIGPSLLTRKHFSKLSVRYYSFLPFYLHLSLFPASVSSFS